MARAPNEKLAKAKELFDKGYKLIDISKELNIPAGTVRRWKKTYNWSNERSNKKSERSVKVHNKKKNNKEPIAEEVEEVLNNSNLTDKQRLFCIYYIKCFNATKAYQKAYEVDYKTAASIGYRLLDNDGVREEIQRLKQNKLNRALLNEDDIFQKYIDIAFGDIGDYLSFGKERKKYWTKDKDGNDIPVIDPETGQQKFVEYNVVNLNDSKNLDTSLLSEVSEGKDGVKVKFQDKMKALQWLSDRMDLLPTLTREKLEMEKRKLALLEKQADDLDEDIEYVIEDDTNEEKEN